MFLLSLTPKHLKSTYNFVREINIKTTIENYQKPELFEGQCINKET